MIRERAVTIENVIGYLADKTRSVNLYRQCFGRWRGVVFFLLVKVMPGYFIEHPMETAIVPGSQQKLLLRLDTTDIDIFTSIFYDQDYEWNFADAPKLVIDAGAYTGLSSAWFAARYPGAEIIAIEPNESNFGLLLQNTAHLQNVHARRAALWHTGGRLVVTDPGTGAWGFQVRELNAEPSELGTCSAQDQVEALTVEDLVREYSPKRIGLLKVDIEGSEVEVFSTSSAWIEEVDAICLELHDRFRPGCSRAFFTAVSDFPVEARRGENILVVRDENQLGDVS